MIRAAQSESLKGFSTGDLILRPFGGEKLMVVRVEAPKGAVAPAHAHPHEQMSLILTGRVRFRIQHDEQVIGSGEIVHIPSNVEHEAEFLEDSIIFDIFHPIREDFLAKVDEQ